MFRDYGNVFLSGGIFSADVNNTGDKDEWSISGRVATELKPAGETGQLHLGASVRYRENSDGSSYSYAQKPFAASAPSTVKISGLSDSDIFVGLEGAYVSDGFFFQTEYGLSQTDCDLPACSGDVEFNSYYADIGYIWGGERVLKNGLFKRTKIDTPAGEGGNGAFAIAARYDVADLNDQMVMGGRQETFMVGGTWYRDKYIRVMVNYAHADFEDSPSYGDSSADSFVVRLQAELY